MITQCLLYKEVTCSRCKQKMIGGYSIRRKDGIIICYECERDE